MTDSTAIQKFLERPETFPEYLHRTKDFDTGIKICVYLIEVKRAASSIEATVLYAMQKEWNPVEHEGEQFYDYFVRITGSDPTTIQNKIERGEMLERVPPKYLPDIQAKDAKVQNVIAAVVLDDEYEVKEEHWEEWSRSDSYQDAAEVSRDIKGTEPRRQWLRLTYDEHGIIWAHTNEGIFEYARINTDPDIEHIIEKANKRVFKAAGITPRVRY